MFHQDAPHCTGREREEMDSAFAFYDLSADETKISLIDERAGLQGVVATLAAHVPVCDSPQFLIKHIHERRQRFLVPRSEGAQ
jgi:hypothetical protein